mgnify:CR=1 FL=1
MQVTVATSNFEYSVTSNRNLQLALGSINAEVVATKLVITKLGGTDESDPDGANGDGSWNDVEAGELFGMEVQLQDADDLVATGASGTVIVQLAAGSGTLSGTDTVTVVDGVATFDDLSMDVKSADFELRVISSSGSLTAATATLSSVWVPSDIAITQGPSGSVNVNINAAVCGETSRV